ncbi:pyruvate:ferredoxin (flavodoxin) oxidoreductase [Collinsella sp. zg1085]|uniref:pyruvate:ferredoxin (flavodoxin) oxidoreductase n=1 Tax=Collinsella sp. zg1085 TaxID=2844380 RepID=UPI001C0B4C2D|nr:pyruvate:ferredoxin (flavodoxin) oxidoreductase [Collinsella sp. zg1085]QWT17822.1 pyruvate:ferredoxin (flavodoxin) oxidoreductase [Collinsella sp. zg1085]
MARTFKSMDGNEAAAYVSYAYTEVAGIYPITPSSPMADHVDIWASQGMKNIFGAKVNVVEMQSEAGAAGTVHGSLGVGALTTTYTASQGLLLMIPNMYKIAGENLPAVFHVSARTVATHALNIFGDHSDVMAARQTGFAMLAEGNVQEVMDLSPVAHLAALEGSVPFINFFDGFRTSHEIQKIAVWDFEDLREMCDMDAVQRFRDHSLNPERPSARGSHEDGDIFFQHRESCNHFYNELPSVVESVMAKVNAKLGTNYGLFNYYGAEDADRVVICMGSFCDTLEEVIDYLNAHGEKVGLVKVRLFRPFSIKHFVDALPKTVKKIAVMDRTKEPGSIGEPLYQDVVSALYEVGKSDITVVGGRYGLGSKDTTPASAFAIFEELAKDAPAREFTVGIVDDVTKLSLAEKPAPNTAAEGTIECKFWGLGGDGTVGANKNSIKIIGDHTDKNVQAYFQYDSKKTGGITISHLRFGDQPIRSTYYVTKADFVACHNPSYVVKGFKMVRDVKPGGTFLVNCQWTPEEFSKHLNAEAKRYIAKNNINVYLINAVDLAEQVGMGKRTNTVLQSAFFALAGVLPLEDALQYMKDAATKSYAKKGQAIVDANHKAIDAGATAFVKFEVPADWAEAVDVVEDEVPVELKSAIAKQVHEILNPVSRMEGDSLPVSAFVGHEDGQFEIGASQYEKRGVAFQVPVWDQDKCIQCNQCAYVCPHASIRPFALDDVELAAAPENMRVIDVRNPKGKGLHFAISVSPLDCMGCTNCAKVCPKDALTMVSQESQLEEQKVFDYAVAHVSEKEQLINNTLVGTQFKKPLLEFSGSCAGCAETAYARLITQVAGDRMFVSNATGCSSIWGNPSARSPFTTDANGHGPAWNNSLFEDNAEHGLGMLLGYEAVQDKLVVVAEKMIASDTESDELKAAAQEWLDSRHGAYESKVGAAKLLAACEASESPLAKEILADKEYLTKKSFWIMGGDGWAYDIGFGGLDHVIASGHNVNIFVFDTEVYSNTGGQASKASNIGQVAQFAAAGKVTKKKSLAEIAMSYGHVYVAQVAMGANPTQTLKAITEAEAYDGPSIIIGYSPCEMHSIKKGGMQNCQMEMKDAVSCGYWNLFRFNPAAAAGKRFALDSKAPAGGYQDFLMNEARYAGLTRSFPEAAEELFARSEKEAMERYQHLVRLKDVYNAVEE